MLFGATWCATAIIRASLHEVAADQVQQREEEDPHDIDEVPVQSCDFNRCVVIAIELPAPGHDAYDGHDSEADDHVQRVQTGHAEVQRIEDLRSGRVLALPME